MIRLVRPQLLGLAGLFLAAVCEGAAFQPGDLVVYRVGDGVAALSGNGNPVFLDEYTPGGTLVQSIALPTTVSGASHQLVASGTATSEGELTRSGDGRYLVLTGYASNLPAATALSGSAAATVPRTVGRVALDGTVDTSTALGDFSDANNPRAAASTDGTSMWVGGGAGGVRYATLGATSSVQLSADSTNVRYVTVAGGQLYASSQKGSIRVATVGSGAPTTAGQTIANLPGTPATGSPDAFVLVDLDGTPGVDTLYVADEAAGLLKYSLSGGGWIASGSAGTGTDAYRGLAAIVSGGAVTLYATRRGDTGGELVSLADLSGFGGALSGTPAMVAAAGASQAFRGVAAAPVAPRASLPDAAADAYGTVAGTALTVGAGAGVLANDVGAPLAIVGHTNPAHGSLTLHGDGSFIYTPANGYVGSDAFSYTMTDAVTLYAPALPPLAVFSGVAVTPDFGSSFVPVPGSSDEYYGMSDLGAHVNGPHGTNVLPIPTFDPSIGKFRLSADGQAVLEQQIPLKDATGHAYSGRVNSQHGSGETLTDLNGTTLAPDPNGYDPEGLVALADGTLWVSDEYGPYITHFDASGNQLERLSPIDGTLPTELLKRDSNRGFEGLAITPDGSTLVAMMQSALDQPDLGGSDPKRITITRIVTHRLADGDTHEYLYLLDEPASNKTAVSEIAALAATTFVVDERDSDFPPHAYKKLWRIDLSGATDVGPASTVGGATYDGSAGGLLVGGQSLEALVDGLSVAGSTSALAAHGITPVGKSLYLDVGATIDAIDPLGRFFAHDKVEGLALRDGGATVLVSNDSDFGVDGITNTTPPLLLDPKIRPATGTPDDGEFLRIDLTRLPVATSSATVTITVLSALVPPDTATRKCEDGIAKSLGKLAACARKCRVKQADAALKGGVFDADACEHGGGAPVSCRAKYDAAAASLRAKGGCPVCLDGAAQAALADGVQSALAEEQGSLYCAGSVALGAGGGGFVPPDKDTDKCEDGVVKSVRKLDGCFTKCRIKQADAAFKLTPFDATACESAAAKSCRGKYDAASAKLGAALTCPPCLDAGARGGAADTAHLAHEQSRPRVYCAGTVPLP
ncbi:MAG TPA: esterase-like activity of phytase family protein [Candidatus Binatia bacterium]|jgi:hypothetical protein